MIGQKFPLKHACDGEARGFAVGADGREYLDVLEEPEIRFDP